MLKISRCVASLIAWCHLHFLFVYMFHACTLAHHTLLHPRPPVSHSVLTSSPASPAIDVDPSVDPTIGINVGLDTLALESPAHLVLTDVNTGTTSNPTLDLGLSTTGSVATTLVFNSLNMMNGHMYKLTILLGAFQSLSGYNVPSDVDTDFFFTTTPGAYEVQAPSISPAGVIGGVVDEETSSLTLTFLEFVSTATLSLRDLSDNTNVVLTPSPAVDTLAKTVVYSVTLTVATAYRLTLTADSFTNVAGVAYPSSDVVYEFVTKGLTAPVLSSTTPVHEEADQATSLNTIYLVFNQGMIVSPVASEPFAYLRDLSHNTIVQTINLKETSPGFVGPQVSISWSVSLSSGTRYRFELPADTLSNSGGQLYSSVIHVDFTTVGTYYMYCLFIH